MVVIPLPYSLEESCPVPWTESAERQLHHDYPYMNHEYSDEEFSIRRYLETLWLPESFNPITNLISSLRRVSKPSGEDSAQEHHLHSLLQPLLLSTRAASDKYRTELVQILADGGGAGEQEEMMMWYAYEYERADAGDGKEVDEEKWRKTWLERLERRETMIQILLNLLKISTPGPKSSAPSKSNKKQKKKQTKQELPPETDEERLESYMDKIAMWQLTSSLDSLPSSQTLGLSKGKAKADRHWTQIFCEDVVEPLFKESLPEQCALLREKVFPSSPFSDDENSDTESIIDGPKSRAGSRARSMSRGPTPLPRVPSVAPSGPSLQRSRSRSLSVSLAQDEASQRANLIEPKRAFSREVSMSLVFKEKNKSRPKAKALEVPKVAKPKLKRETGVTLVADTPVKRKRTESFTEHTSQSRSQSQSWSQQSLLQFTTAVRSAPSPPPSSSSSPGNVYIEETPFMVRKRQAQRQDTLSLATMSSLSPLSPMSVDKPCSSTPAVAKVTSRRGNRTQPGPPQSQDASFVEEADAWLDENADDSFTGSFGSPDVLLLGEGNSNQRIDLVSPSPAVGMRKGVGLSAHTRSMSMQMDTGNDVEMETPTKKKKGLARR